MRKPLLFIVLILLLGNLDRLAAQTRSISGTFKGVSFDEFVRQLEERTGYSFYYNPKSFDSLQVTLVVNNKPVHEVFESLFKDTDYHYAIHQDRVFFTRGRRIYTGLPGDPAEPVKQGKENAQVIITDLSRDRGTETKVSPASLEIKLYEIGSYKNPRQC